MKNLINPIMTDNKQIKACAELDDYVKHRLYSKEWPAYVPKLYIEGTSPTTQIKLITDFKYLASLDAIVPLIVKWCGDDTDRWSNFFNYLGFSYNTEFSHKALKRPFKKTPRQLTQALLQSAGVWKE